ncbi:MAG: EAL domain-containing protein, partial [Lysobacteraceae bacterium]
LSVRVRGLQKAEHLQGALYAIAEMAGSKVEMQKMLRGLHEIVAGLMYAENFYIALYDADKDSLRFLYFADTLDTYVADPEMGIPLAGLTNSLTVALIRHGKPLLGPPAVLRAQFGLPRDIEHGPDSSDWLGVPMLSDDKVRGAIVVQSYDAGVGYNEEDRALLSYVAQHILTALERKQQQSELERRVFERTRDLAMANRELRSEVVERQRAERLQAALYRIAELSIVADTLEQFYMAVHAEVDELLYARNFLIALLSEDGDELEFPYSVDERDEIRPRRKLARGLTEYVLRTGRPLLVDRAAIDNLAQADEVHSIGTPSVCWLGVPLLRDERTVGVIVVQSYTPEILFTPRDQELLTFVSFHIASGLLRKRAQDSLKTANAELESRVEERTRELASANRQLRGQISERERAEESLTHQALHDALTGLPNRTRLLDRLQRAMAAYQRNPERGFAVLFLDLDRFKIVNDSVGHLVGDELLKHASRLIAGAVRMPDTVARLGGDEFAVLVEDIADVSEACEVASRILNALSAPITIAGKDLFTSASIGITMVGPQYHHPEEMLRDADVAMYRAKNKGRNRYEQFDEALRFEALRVHDLESDLRRAIVNGDFVPYFQPIVRLTDGETIGFESLLRWKHDERGVLPPMDFLNVAEDSGLIEQIDWLMFEETCRQFDKIATNAQYVSINVSPQHFRSPDLARRLLDLASRHHIAPGRLRIELTEGALLDNSQLVLGTLEQLHDGGIRALLDDFGTGYSALSYLHRFPIGALKIDRSFVADLVRTGSHGSQAVVRAILALAQSMGMDVVGEGIETRAQSDMLVTLGCGYGQGFLFAHPKPLAEAMAG